MRHGDFGGRQHVFGGQHLAFAVHHMLTSEAVVTLWESGRHCRRGQHGGFGGRQDILREGYYV